MRRVRTLSVIVPLLGMWGLASCSPDGAKTPAASQKEPAKTGSTAAAPTKLIFTTDIDAARTEAKSSGRIIMIDFYTTWCHWCKVLDEKTFPDARVAKLAPKLIPIKLDAEREGRQLAQTYGVRGFPAIFFVNAAGQTVGNIDGYLPPEEFVQQVNAILANAAKKTP